MTKTQFKKIMTELKDLIEASRKVNKAMKELSPDFGGFCNNRAETLIVDILKIAMNDKDDWIEYYIYELNWGTGNDKYKVWKNGKEIPFKTLDDLWNIIEKKIG